MFGGTFDPPHIGHLVMASDVREALSLDRVLMVCAGEPWQKVGVVEVSTAEDRLAMLEAAAAGLDGLEVCDIEVRRSGPTYTVETLDELAASNPGAQLFLVLGADAASGIPTWHDHERLAELCTVAVVDRPGSPLTIPDWLDVERVDAPRLEVSSTELRRRVADGRSIRFLVPDPVISVIGERGLYADRR